MGTTSKSTPEQSRLDQDTGELPSREALIERLEAQRMELLRAMTCVDRARRTLEEHVAKRHELYQERMLEELGSAHDALATAYPMLEGIAAALHVEEMLKQHTPERSQVEPEAEVAAATKR